MLCGNGRKGSVSDEAAFFRVLLSSPGLFEFATNGVITSNTDVHIYEQLTSAMNAFYAMSQQLCSDKKGDEAGMCEHSIYLVNVSSNAFWTN